MRILELLLPHGVKDKTLSSKEASRIDMLQNRMNKYVDKISDPATSHNGREFLKSKLQDDYDELKSTLEERHNAKTGPEPEGSTFKNSLHTIIRVATDLEKQMSDNEDFPEWESEMIGSVRDQMVTMMNYEISKKEQGVTEDDASDVEQRMLANPEVIWEDFEAVDDDTLLESAAWKRKEGKSKSGGLNKKGVASYRKEHPGSKLQTAVTTKPSKLKPGSKSAKRRKSFCARMGGMKGPMKKPNGDPTRKALALHKWNCHEGVEHSSNTRKADAPSKNINEFVSSNKFNPNGGMSWDEFLKIINPNMTKWGFKIKDQNDTVIYSKQGRLANEWLMIVLEPQEDMVMATFGTVDEGSPYMNPAEFFSMNSAGANKLLESIQADFGLNKNIAEKFTIKEAVNKLPLTDNDFDLVKQLMCYPIPAVIAPMYLQEIFDDDEFNDMLKEWEETNPNMDIRPQVVEWFKRVMPDQMYRFTGDKQTMKQKMGLSSVIHGYDPGMYHGTNEPITGNAYGSR